MLDVEVPSNEDQVIDDEPPIEQPPSLSDAIKMIRLLRVLSTTQYPEWHSFLIQITIETN